MSVGDVGGDDVVQFLDILGKERPVASQGRVVAALGGTRLALARVPVQAALGQAKDEVAEQRLGKPTFIEDLLGFGEMMSRINHGSTFILEVSNELSHSSCRRDIESTCWFIQEQNPRVV